MVNNTNKGWRSLLWVGTFLSLYMFQVGFGTSIYLIALKITGVIDKVLVSKCVSYKVYISNGYKVTAKSVFPLCTSSRTVISFFDSCLFWLSLFVYIQAATVSCAEAAMSLSSHTHTH